MEIRAFLAGETSTFHADSPQEAAHRLAKVMGTDARVLPDQAYQMIADAVDVLVQIGIRKEVRRVVEIARVCKDLSDGEVGFEAVFRYCEDSPANAPRWERVGYVNSSKPVPIPKCAGLQPQ